MNQTTTNNPPASGPAEDRNRRAPDAFRRIGQLASECDALGPFCRGSLDVIRERFNAPIVTLTGRLSAGEINLTSIDPDGDADADAWRRPLEALVLDIQVEGRAAARLYRRPDEDGVVALIAAAATLDAGGSPSIIATVVNCPDRRAAEAAMHELQGIAALVSSGAAAIDSVRSGARFQDSAQRQSLIRAADYRTLHEFAFAITNNLRSRVACDMVALGAIKRSRAELLSISGLDDIKPRSPGVVAMKQAMEECYDCREPVVSQRRDDWNGGRKPQQHRLHRRWSEQAGNATVASVPMTDGDRIVGVVSLRRAGDRPFSEEEIDAIREMLRPYGPALGLVSRATRTLLAHAVDSVRNTLLWLIKPGGYGPKLALLVLLAAIGWVSFGTIPHRVAATCVVAAGGVRHVAAPFESRIGEAVAREGDVVREGDVLCRLDTRDLELERAQLRSERAVLDIEINQAVAASDVAAAQLARAQREITRSRLQLIERRIALATITASADGLIIRGDLSRRIGEVVPQGEPLFEIAPLDEIGLELNMPEHAIAHIDEGLTGTFASEARPERAFNITVDRIAPASEIRDRANVFVAHADFDAADDVRWLRVGMEGVARIEAGDRPVWWVVGHRVIDQIRMRLWL